MTEIGLSTSKVISGSPPAATPGGDDCGSKVRGNLRRGRYTWARSCRVEVGRCRPAAEDAGVGGDGRCGRRYPSFARADARAYARSLPLALLDDDDGEPPVAASIAHVGVGR